MNKFISELKKNLLINGEQVTTSTYQSLSSPYTGEEIAKIAVASKEQTLEAINVAVRASSIIRKMTAFERAEILEKVASILSENADEAARIIALEAAKPISFAKAEVLRTIETYKFAAEEAKRIHGETIPFDASRGGAGRFGYTLREPIGVIGAITPFNFPLNLVAHKVGPAIAAGNSIILKPASQTPLSALFIAEIFKEAGLPAGVLNVVTGSGRIVGDTIVNDDRVNMITFTGSVEVGKEIRKKAGLKKTTLELGSNSALIIDRDVVVDNIIDRCIMGAFSNQGQVCISLQRVYVIEEVYEEFLEKFTIATKQLKMGDPLDQNTDISSLISKDETDRILSWLAEAKEKATIITGGTAIDGIIEPTIVTNADPNLKICCQEVFAPIVVVNKVTSIEEAVRKVNDSRFGLQAGIYTENIKSAQYAINELQVGGVIVNDVPTFRVDNMPYGGVKDSGTGREGVKFAVEEMTELKLVVWNQS